MIIIINNNNNNNKSNNNNKCMYKQKACQHSIKMSVQEKHNYNLTTDDDCFITGTL